MIEHFAEHIEQQVAFVRKVQATLAYPALMLFVGIDVVIFLLTSQIFSDMGRALPVPTQILLAVSDSIQSGWWIILLLALCIMLGICGCAGLKEIDAKVIIQRGRFQFLIERSYVIMHI